MTVWDLHLIECGFPCTNWNKATQMNDDGGKLLNPCLRSNALFAGH